MQDTAVINGIKCRARIGSKRDAPVVFLVHGRAGNFDVMWAFRRCIPEHFHIIAPQAFLEDPIGGYSWWQVANPASTQADSLVAANRLNDFTTKALDHFGILPTKAIALGFSQGAGLLSILIQQEPRKFAGVALLAGFVIKPFDRDPIAKSVDGAGRALVFMAHGTRDSTISIDLARSGADYLRNQDFSVEFQEDDVEHKVGATGMRKLKEWVAQFDQ